MVWIILFSFTWFRSEQLLKQIRTAFKKVRTGFKQLKTALKQLRTAFYQLLKRSEYLITVLNSFRTDQNSFKQLSTLIFKLFRRLKRPMLQCLNSLNWGCPSSLRNTLLTIYDVLFWHKSFMWKLYTTLFLNQNLFIKCNLINVKNFCLMI